MEVRMGSAQTGRHFPVPQRSLSLDIKGNKTDIVISKYEDNFLVIVTQIGCMGTLLTAKKDGSWKDKGVSNYPTYSVSVLFGKRDEPFLLVCARQIIEHISCSGSARQLVISLGLKDCSQETLKDVTSAIIENRLW